MTNISSMARALHKAGLLSNAGWWARTDSGASGLRLPARGHRKVTDRRDEAAALRARHAEAGVLRGPWNEE